MQEEQNQWDLYLGAILFSYLVFRQDSTKLSPFYLMHSRQARLPVDFNINWPRHTILMMRTVRMNLQNRQITNPEFEESLQTMVAFRQKALENIHVAQGRQKTLYYYYDAKHCHDKNKHKVGSATATEVCARGTNQWDLYLGAILFSYLVFRQDSTKLSPFYLMYSRRARLPVDFNINWPIHTDDEDCENESPE